ncbi:LytTR family DNA-binding domain-containing protein [Clostridiaceae bacterium M8S5]|nr:LytTR family DNA-binding domain-containing protein [Clostridiaceae bacterium M8S5]
MKVSIEPIGKEQEEEIIIRCYEVNDDILKIINGLRLRKDIILGYEDSKIHRIGITDIYYFEAVDNKVFIYCKEKVFESKNKLYELEEMCGGKKFFRASKSTIINLTKISFVKPSLSGRFEAKLDNGERLYISRKYVSILKRMLDL